MEAKHPDAIIAAARKAHRALLTPPESAAILSHYAIPLPAAHLAPDLEAAKAAAAALGYPVALKVASEAIVHKSDVGGVKINIADAQELTTAYQAIMASVAQNCPGARVDGVLVQAMVQGRQELIIGVKRDPSFGPVLLLGLGGVWVELLKDVSLRVCPVSADDVRAMLSELKGYPLLTGYRGAPACDLEAAVDLCLKVSRLALDLPDLQEMDLNPVLLKREGQGAVAVDYRLIISPMEVD